MSDLPDRLNLQKRRAIRKAERKGTERSLEKFTCQSSNSAMATTGDYRNRINSDFSELKNYDALVSQNSEFT